MRVFNDSAPPLRRSRPRLRGATSSYGHISTWETEGVTDMSRLFCALSGNGNCNTAAASFDEDIGAWDTSGVTTMSSMFSGASAFDQDLGWYVRPARGLLVRAGPGVRIRVHDPFASWYERAVDARERAGRRLELCREAGLGPSGGEPRPDGGPGRRTSSSPSPGTYSSPGGPRIKSGSRNVKCDASRE